MEIGLLWNKNANFNLRCINFDEVNPKTLTSLLPSPLLIRIYYRIKEDEASTFRQLKLLIIKKYFTI